MRKFQKLVNKLYHDQQGELSSAVWVIGVAAVTLAGLVILYVAFPDFVQSTWSTFSQKVLSSFGLN